MIESSDFYTVSEGTPMLWTMLERGGGAVFTIGNEYRLLMHNPMTDQPVSRLPWPLNLIQPYRCTLQVTQLSRDPHTGVPKSGRLIRERNYIKRSQRSTAIRALLAGAKPDDFVSITIGVWD